MSFNPSPSRRASDAPSAPSRVENPDRLSLSWLPVYMEATEKPVFAHGFSAMLTIGSQYFHPFPILMQAFNS